jgi:hypothetical protein
MRQEHPTSQHREATPGHAEARGSHAQDGNEAGRTATAIHPQTDIRPLRAEHMEELSARLRAMDRLEVASAMPGQPIDRALVQAMGQSIRSRAGFWNGELVACWGIVPRDAGHTDGAPWLLATDAIDRPEGRRAFLRHGKTEMLRLVDGFGRLWNVVHRDNRTARRWLRFMGFEFRDPKDYLISGEPFIRFEMEVM